MAVRASEISRVYEAYPEKKATLYFLVLGFLALIVGSLFGPFQALNYGNVDAYPLLKRLLPFVQSYYQGLTLHGVLNAIVFTQLFAQAIMVYLPARELNMRPNMGLMWLSWWMAFIGLVVAALPLLANEATVLSQACVPDVIACGAKARRWGPTSEWSPASRTTGCSRRSWTRVRPSRPATALGRYNSPMGSPSPDSLPPRRLTMW